jgi:hypothetical protein
MIKQTAEETTADETIEEIVESNATDVAENKPGEEGKTADETSAGKTDEVAIDEVVVTIGDEAPTPEDEEVVKAPEWVRELRKSTRELSRKNKELERQLAEKDRVVESTELGQKPKMSDVEIDYDAEKFEAALTKWNDRKRVVDNESAQRQAAEKKTQDAWAERLSQYGESKTQLKVKDFAESESTVSDAMSVTQQSIIIQGCDRAALVIYALGKNSTKLKELATITAVSYTHLTLPTM